MRVKVPIRGGCRFGAPVTDTASQSQPEPLGSLSRAGSNARLGTGRPPPGDVGAHAGSQTNIAIAANADRYGAIGERNLASRALVVLARGPFVLLIWLSH